MRFGRVPKKEKAKIMEQMHKVNSQSQVNLLNTILENESDVTVKVVEAHLRTCEFTQSKLRCFLEKAWQAPQFVNCPAHMVRLLSRLIYIVLFQSVSQSFSLFIYLLLFISLFLYLFTILLIDVPTTFLHSYYFHIIHYTFIAYSYLKC